MPNRTLFYAQGLRWIGSIFTDAAQRLEHSAQSAANGDPRVQREVEEYLDTVRSRIHLHF